MMDHAFESIAEEREREAFDADQERAAFHYHRGDDRLEPDPFDDLSPLAGVNKDRSTRFCLFSHAPASVAWEGQPARQADAGASEHHHHSRSAA